MWIHHPDSALLQEQEMEATISAAEPSILHVEAVELFSSAEPARISIDPPPPSDPQQHPILIMPPVDIPSSSKRSKMISDEKQSKRAMYCRNAYMHFLVRKLIESNPYISLRSILAVLNSKRVDCKEVTVAKARADERARLITSLKSLLPSFLEMRSAPHTFSCLGEQVLRANPTATFTVSSFTENKKAVLSSVFFALPDARILFDQSKVLVLDCTALKGEYGGVLFYASILDGGEQPVLLAFMVANEETHLTWREFLNSLQLAGVGTAATPAVSSLLHLCDLLTDLFPRLCLIRHDLGMEPSSWSSMLPQRRKKATAMEVTPLRSLFFRCAFATASQSTVLIAQFSSLAPELTAMLMKLPQWSRSQLPRAHEYYTTDVTTDMELLLNQQYLRFLMLDDVVSGLLFVSHSRTQQRRALYSGLPAGSLTPFYAHLAKSYASECSRMTAQCVRANVYCVSDKSDVFDVDFEKKTCSCHQWEELAFPCVHCWCVMEAFKMGVMEVVDAFFTNDAALKMCGDFVLPAFSHDLSRQVKYYQQSLQSAQNKTLVVVPNESNTILL